MAEKFSKFGERLKESIKKSGTNVNRLAKKIVVDPNTIWNYIDPKKGSFPNSTVLYNISKELKVSMEWLLTGEGGNQIQVLKIITKEERELFDLLEKAEYVLKSKTRHGNSLKENILSFHEAVTEKEEWQKKLKSDNPGGAKSSPNKAT